MTGPTQQSVTDRHSIGVEVSVIPEGSQRSRILIGDRLISLQFTDSESGADKLTLSIDNFTGDLWDDATFRKGNFLDVAWGYPGMMAPKRRMVILKATGGAIMNVEARARSVLLHREKLCRTYENLTRSEIVHTIAARHGYAGINLHVEDTTERIDVVNQASMTDASFLKRLAQREGFEFFIDWDGLHWHRRDFGQAPARRFVYYGQGVTADENTIIDYDVENDLTAKPGRTVVQGRDPKTKKPFSQVGSNDSTDRDVLTEVVEVPDIVNGRWVQSTRQAHQETIPTAEDTATKAKTRVDGRYRKIQQTAVKLRLTVLGNPLILAKTTIDVSGVAKRLDMRYYIREVEHTVGANGYLCSLRCITDGTKGYKGISTQDALSPRLGTGRGHPESLGAVIADAAALLRSESSARRIVDRSPSAAQIARDLDSLGTQINGNPQNLQLAARVAELGDEVRLLAREAGNRSLETTGKALQTTANRAVGQIQEARSKGRLNTQTLAARGEKPLLETVAVEDPITGESREEFMIRRS